MPALKAGEQLDADGLPHVGAIIWPGESYYSTQDQGDKRYSAHKLKGEEVAQVGRPAARPPACPAACLARGVPVCIAWRKGRLGAGAARRAWQPDDRSATQLLPLCEDCEERKPATG